MATSGTVAFRPNIEEIIAESFERCGIKRYEISFESIPNMNPNNNSLISIGFSLFVVIIASLNLVLDFDFIEEASEANVPKYMEWYAAFGLLITLIWLYLEILRLLSKLQSRRN